MTVTSFVVGYFAAWSVYAPAFFVSDIPANKLTHVNYAAAIVDKNGKIALGDVWADTQMPFPNNIPNKPFNGSFNQLLVLKQKYPNLQTLISVGGWVNFSFFFFSF
jgi:chitinase